MFIATMNGWIPHKQFQSSSQSSMKRTPSPKSSPIFRKTGHNGEITIQEIIVVDNGCTDNTAAIAERNGARVVTEPRRGYGYACLAGIAALETKPPRYRRLSRWRLQRLSNGYATPPATDMQRRCCTRHRHKDTRRRKSGVTPASTLRQLARLLLDPTLLRRALHRLRSLPSHPLLRTTEPKHAGQNLRLDSRDAAESRETGYPFMRSPGPVSQAHRHLQNHRHPHRHPQSRLQNPHHPHLPSFLGIE